jgi:NAD(P)H dehydrogenase (quinone)
MVAVTGATGEVGRRVVARLAAAGLPHRSIVRDASRATGDDVRVASDYGARDEMAAAFEGAATVFLIPAAENAERVEQHTTAADAALAAGVPRLVYLSFLDAAPDATFTLARDRWATEQHIRATGLNWTFLRMNLYVDFVPRMVGEDGVIRGPAGDGRVSAILRDAVAAAAAAVLTSQGHAGKSYDLTGPSSFTLAEAQAE